MASLDYEFSIPIRILSCLDQPRINPIPSYLIQPGPFIEPDISKQTMNTKVYLICQQKPTKACMHCILIVASVQIDE